MPRHSNILPTTFNAIYTSFRAGSVIIDPSGAVATGVSVGVVVVGLPALGGLPTAGGFAAAPAR